ncbi:MAG: UDP-N-acetylmuramate dehydrogenase [Candidatus Kapabacteria bacterium]|nr:UDP-N-acetylmuramate dehydrogenase [Candidatus Kapabacteria bacterium]
MIFVENFDLKKNNTFGVSAKAKYYCEITNEADFSELLYSDLFNNNKKIILGGGSNILFTKDYDGLIININIKGIDIVNNDKESVTIKVGAGVNWHEFVKFTVENHYYGLENLALIPGKVGAAPVQNIGAYGVEQESCYFEAEGIYIKAKAMQPISKGRAKFGYRDSIFKNKLKDEFVITSVIYKLSKLPKYNLSYKELENTLKSNKLEITQKNIFDCVVNLRTNKIPNPELIGNCGSFFKNPIISNEIADKLLENFPEAKTFDYLDGFKKVSAGWLIEQAGWKGKRLNENSDAGVSENHALVLVNYGEASGAEILELSSKIIESVNMIFNIILDREVNIL